MHSPLNCEALSKNTEKRFPANAEDPFLLPGHAIVIQKGRNHTGFTFVRGSSIECKLGLLLHKRELAEF